MHNLQAKIGTAINSQQSDSLWKIIHVMRKPVYAICEQQRHRSACSLISASVVRFLDSIISLVSLLLTLANPCSWADWFVSYLVENPEDRFSHDEAQIIQASLRNYLCFFSQSNPIKKIIIWKIKTEIFAWFFLSFFFLSKNTRRIILFTE